MILETKRLILRPWTQSDAESLYEYAKDPAIGPPAGWPPHKSVEESRAVIQTVFTGAQCYAICEKGSGKAIGAVELKLTGHTDMTERDDECELGYWLGKPFWGRGYMPEAAAALIRYGFEALGMTTIWCGYYDGNEKSRRVQEKLGFVYHHTCQEVPVPLLGEIRVGHTSILTKERWSRSRTMHIETGRLTITEFTMDMAEAVHRNSLDEDNRRFVPDEVFETVEEAADTIAFLMGVYQSGDGPLVYPVLKKDGTCVGYVQAVPLEDDTWEIGYHIGGDFTRQGYATEAVTAFLPVIMEKLGIRQIAGVCLAENIASVKVMERCGFTKEFEGVGPYQGEERNICKFLFSK